MRSAWRLVLSRSLSQLLSRQIQSLSPQVRPPNPSFRSSPILGHHAPLNPRSRHLSSSAPALERKGPDHTLVAEILSKPISPDEIKSELDALGFSLDDEAVNTMLRSLDGDPSAARKFFEWVSGREDHKLRSKSYNIMLGILSRKGCSDDFWGLVDAMKDKGYGISKSTYSLASENFKREDMEKDLERLNKLQQSLRPHKNVDPSIEVCKILSKKDEEDAAEIRSKLKDLGITLTPDLVFQVLEKTGSSCPRKALVFFRWVEEIASLKIDGRAYNSMARALIHKDWVDDFWDIIRKMKDTGCELERETYMKASAWFYRQKMAVRAVDLYEYAMGGTDQPSVQEFMFVLRKIVTGKDLDLDLISRVVRIFINAGNSVKRSNFVTIFKALRSFDKLGECDKFVKAMEKGGFVADDSTHDQVVNGLSDARKYDEATEYIDGLESSGCNPGLKAWTSLVQKQSLAGELDMALSSFHKMVEKRGGENVGSAFEMLVKGLCQKNRDEDAFKILKEMVTRKSLLPWHSTYKFLIESLLDQGRVKEASTLLGSMKSQGFPPYIDPFIGYVSKSGTVEDAIGFLKAMTVKEFPSREVFIRLFRALLQNGRHEVAHNILSKSPGSVRNHADVLDLFYSMKTDETPAALAA